MLEGRERYGECWEFFFQGKKARKHFKQKEKHWGHSTDRNIYYTSFNFSLSALNEEQTKAAI